MTDKNNLAPGEHDEDAIWGDDGSSPNKGQGATSAFTAPSMVVEADSHFPDDQEHHEEENTAGDEAAKPKSNVMILALAGLIVLGVVGGVGYMVNQKYFAQKASSDSSAVFETPLSKSAVNANVFDEAPPINPADAPPPLVAASAPQGAELVPSVLALAAPAGISSAPVAIATTVVVPPKVEKPVVVVIPAKVDSPVVVVQAKPVEIEKPTALPSEVKVEVAPKKVVTHKRAARQVVVATASPNTKASRSTGKAKVKSKGRAKAKAKAVSAEAGEKAEIFMLPAGIKVKSVYPLSGKDVQAWLTDGAGRTEIVRVGDSLRSGSRVTAIVAEKGLVITDAGTITTRGAR